MPSEQHKLVPLQTQGLFKDLNHDVVLDTVEDAEELFVVAKDKLLDVNHWTHTGEPEGAQFQLLDEHGTILDRPAHGHDLVRITKAGVSTGEAYDLLQIEEIAYDDYPDEDHETFAMRLKPTIGLLQMGESTATSTIVIERRGRHLTAHYYGRNEGTDTSLPVSDAQWLGLTAWLIRADTND
jgi:hypothetical protein